MQELRMERPPVPSMSSCHELVAFSLESQSSYPTILSIELPSPGPGNQSLPQPLKCKVWYPVREVLPYIPLYRVLY